MKRDWRRDLVRHPKVIELKRRLDARKSKLRSDKEFVIETEKLKHALETALPEYHEDFANFFRHFSDPTGAHRRRVHECLDSLRNRRLKLLLARYLRYVSRFGVTLRLDKGRFEEVYLIPWGSRFHVRIKKEHFEPVDSYPGSDTPFEYFFESEKVHTWPALNEQISLGTAKFVQIEDNSFSSVLTRLEDFAYDPEGLTFVLHNAEQPYLLCLVGEKVTNDIWRDGSKVVSSFLRMHFNRGKAGRPRNVPRLQQTIDARKKAGPLKAKFPVGEGTEKDFLREQVFSARVGKIFR